jgi:diacylglycerol kinase family enzyme
MQTSNHKTWLGVIPVGRGNDFAFGMGIPVDFNQACMQFITPKSKVIDIGQVVGGFFPEGRYFGNGVGIGFDAVVGFEALKLKFLTGFPSYIVAALKTIFLYFKAPRLQLDLDDEQIVDKFLMVSVMNGIRMGGGFYMAPRGDPTDGKFSLCIVSELGKFATFPFILKFMKGTQEGDPKVRMVNSQTVKVTALEGTIPAHVDGETICYEGAHIEIHLIPGALELVI